MAFNEQAFKARWRAACLARGINPEAGPSIYQAANAQAEQMKAGHHLRMAELVMLWAVRQDMRNGALWDDGYGAIDLIKIERQQRRTWWIFAPYWRLRRNDYNGFPRPTEYQAVKNIHAEIMELQGRPETVIAVIRSIWRDERERVLPPAARQPKHKVGAL